MDLASIIATFPRELRDEALMGFIGDEEACPALSTSPPISLSLTPSITLSVKQRHNPE